MQHGAERLVANAVDKSLRAESKGPSLDNKSDELDNSKYEVYQTPEVGIVENLLWAGDRSKSQGEDLLSEEYSLCRVTTTADDSLEQTNKHEIHLLPIE
jgi:hypothetical protein